MSRTFARALLLWSTLLLVAELPAGCGNPCDRIAEDRKVFLSRKPQGIGPHLAIVIPHPLFERIVRERLKDAPVVRVSPRSLGPLAQALGAGLVLRATGAHLAGARQGLVGVAIDVDVSVEGDPATALTLSFDAEVRPELDLRAGAIAVVVRADALRDLRPRLSPGAADRLGQQLASRLPPAARMLLPPGESGRVASRVVEELVHSAYPLLRDNVLSRLGDAVRVRVRLHGLPLAALTTRSIAAPRPALVVEATSALPIDHALSSPPLVPSPDELGLSIAGAAVAEVGNFAMAHGSIPARYDEQGNARADGPIEAGLAWTSGPRPFKVIAWRSAGTCVRVRAGATPKLAVVSDVLRLQVTDGTVEEVQGPAWIEAAFPFWSIGAKAIAMTHHVAAGADVEIAGRKLRLALSDARFAGDDLTLRVKLDAPQQPMPRRRP